VAATNNTSCFPWMAVRAGTFTVGDGGVVLEGVRHPCEPSPLPTVFKRGEGPAFGAAERSIYEGT